MKCWKCGKDLPDGASLCPHCGASLIRKAPVTGPGRAMRMAYDRFGVDSVLSKRPVLSAALGDLMEDCRKLRSQIDIALSSGADDLYLYQIRSAGRPDPAFYYRILTHLTAEAGLSEKAAGELMGYFDEMIGWTPAASSAQQASSNGSERNQNRVCERTDPSAQQAASNSAAQFSQRNPSPSAAQNASHHEAGPTSHPEPQVKHRPQPSPRPAPQNKPQPQPSPRPAPQANPQPQPSPRPAPQNKPQPQASPRPEPQVKPQPQPSPRPAPQNKPQPQVESKPQPKTQPASQPKPQPGARSAAQTGAAAQPGPAPGSTGFRPVQDQGSSQQAQDRPQPSHGPAKPLVSAPVPAKPPLRADETFKLIVLIFFGSVIAIAGISMLGVGVPLGAVLIAMAFGALSAIKGLLRGAGAKKLKAVRKDSAYELSWSGPIAGFAVAIGKNWAIMGSGEKILLPDTLFAQYKTGENIPLVLAEISGNGAVYRGQISIRRV